MFEKYGIQIAIVVTICLWASAFVGIRAALHGGYHTGSLAFFRYLIASIAVIPVYFKIPNRVKIRWRDIPAILIVGIIGIGIYNITLNMGEVAVSASIASFIIGLVPVISAVIAVAFLGERLAPIAIIGIVISVIGVALIAMCNSNCHENHWGIFMLLIAAVSMSIYSTLQKPLLRRMKSLQFTCYAMWSGTLVMLIFIPETIHDVPRATMAATLAVIYLGIFPGVIAYALWSYVLSSTQACKTITSMYGIPIVATFLGWVFLGEIPELFALVGGVISLFGAYLVSRK